MGQEGEEGFINKFIAILRMKGGWGRELEGQRLVPRKEVAEKIENRFDFF